MPCNNNNFEFIIKKNDTNPPLRYKIFDCDSNPVDLEGDFLVEASMWSNAKIKKDIDDAQQDISFADNVGFETASIGSNLLLKTSNRYELMTVEDVDDINKIIYAQRAQLNSVASVWKKGSPIKIIKFLNFPATKELEYSDGIDINGEKTTSLSGSYLVYNWNGLDTSTPGEYFFEFK